MPMVAIVITNLSKHTTMTDAAHQNWREPRRDPILTAFLVFAFNPHTAKADFAMQPPGVPAAPPHKPVRR